VRFLKTSFICGTVLFAASLPLIASSHPEVLVVYNTNSTDSLNVANYYMSPGRRNIPASNLCAITPPAYSPLSLSDYTTYVKTPIQNCLNTVGKNSILYIVMSYMNPNAVVAGPMGAAAIDSYLADIWDKYASQPFLVIPNLTQPYYADSQSQGNVYTPFQSFAQYRANARNPLIYSVWRLDAGTPALSMGLVDQATSAENAGGPSGQACIDETGNPLGSADASYSSANWDLYQASQFLTAAGVTVLTDDQGTTFGTPPSPLCPDTAFYSGWYNTTYNNAFTWQTGSIGWDLDSYAAWAQGALPAGVGVTTYAVSEPYLQGLVRPGGAFRNLLEGASVGDAFLRNTRWIKWEIQYIGDPLYTPFGTGRYPFSPLQPVNSFMISPQEIVGGANSTGTITLSAPANGAMTYTLTAPAGVTVPPSVTVAAGATKGSFPITTAAVLSAQSQFSVLTAASASLTLQNTIITDPLLGTFVPSVSTTMAGFPIGVTAILNGRAPAGGAVIGLSSDNPAITVPATVTVPAGSMVTTFLAGSTPVSSGVTANITGTYAGAMVKFSLTAVPGIGSIDATVNPINPGAQTAIEVYTGAYVPAGDTATIQMTSSDPVSLPVPATVTVPAGTHYTNFYATAASGAPSETVTITATYAGSSASVMVTIN